MLLPDWVARSEIIAVAVGKNTPSVPVSNKSPIPRTRKTLGRDFLFYTIPPRRAAPPRVLGMRAVGGAGIMWSAVGRTMRMTQMSRIMRMTRWRGADYMGRALLVVDLVVDLADEVADGDFAVAVEVELVIVVVGDGVAAEDNVGEVCNLVDRRGVDVEDKRNK